MARLLHHKSRQSASSKPAWGKWRGKRSLHKVWIITHDFNSQLQMLYHPTTVTDRQSVQLLSGMTDSTKPGRYERFSQLCRPRRSYLDLWAGRVWHCLWVLGGGGGAVHRRGKEETAGVLCFHDARHDGSQQACRCGACLGFGT